MKASATLSVSGRIRFVLVPENGRIYQWPFYPSTNVCSTHTDSPSFARWKRYAASLAIQKHGSSRSFAAQKNSLQRLWPNAPKLVRQEASTSSRPLLWRHSHLSGVRDSTSAVPALWKSEKGTARLSGQQPALYQTLFLVCGQTMSQQHGIGHCLRIEPGLTHRQRTGHGSNPGFESVRRVTLDCGAV